MNGFRNRVIHLIRHAESEFNVLANHQTEGFVPCVTKLDANLTPKGFGQAKTLRHKLSNETVNGYPPNHRLAPKNADIVITSPLSRAILTASHSLPFEQYQYIIRPEISEQIENTTDIPVSKDELISKFPYLQNQISSLPDIWWYRHPNYRNNDTPQCDAKLLHSLNGEEPASESKEIVRRRVQWFFKWLFNNKNVNKFDNIVVYSHCCTIFEMERFLRGFTDDSQHKEQLTMPQNTEIRSFELFEHIINDNVPIINYNEFDDYYQHYHSL